MPAESYKYSEAYVQEIVTFMGEGYSATAFAGEIGVAKNTIYHWAKTYPEFNDALERGRAKRARWWEDRLRSIAMTGEGNSIAAIFALKNAAPHEFADRVSVPIDPNGDQTVSLLSDDLALARAIAFLLSKGARDAGPQPLTIEGNSHG